MELDLNALYQANLGRAPDAEGLAYWGGLLNSGMSAADVTNAFYNAAAQEVQGSTSGLSSGVASWDRDRIVNSMKFYDGIDDRFGSDYSFWNSAGDTRTTSAADRLNGLPGNYFDVSSGGGGTAAQPVQQPMPQQNLGMTQFGDPFQYNQKNPYLQQMADSIKSQVTENLNRSILPGLSSAAVATGGFGGSRQGVVEANALKDANNSLSNALTGMYFGDYNNAMNRQLGKYGADLNFYTAQRGQDLQQTALGANLLGQAMTGMLGQGQGIFNLGLTSQQAPWQSMANFGGVAQPFTGFGTTTGSTNGSSGAGFLGGAIGASQMYNLWQK